MFRLASLVVIALSLVAASSASDAREQILRHLEEVVKPCVLHNVGCPSNQTYEIYLDTVRQLRRFQFPEECKCDTSKEACNRNCYYAFALAMAVHSSTRNLTDAAEIAAITQRIREHYQEHVRPCIADLANCRGTPVDYSHIVSSVQMYVKHYSLPEGCDFETETEANVRLCYYNYVKRSYLASLPSK